MIKNVQDCFLASEKIQYNDPKAIRIINLLEPHVHKDARQELALIILLLNFQESLGSICLLLDSLLVKNLWLKMTISTENPDTKKPGWAPETSIENICDSTYLLLHFSNVIGLNSPSTPLVLMQNGSEACIYYQKNYYLYNNIIQRKKLFMKRPGTISHNMLKGIVDHIFHIYPLLNGEKAMEYHHLQKRAVFVALRKNFCIITGGPGTGKTAVIINIVRAMLHLDIPPESIALCAPTGRASGRLSESIQNSLIGIQKNKVDQKLNRIETQTIHKLLAWDKTANQGRYNRDNPLPYEVIIIDESSMIDLVMFSLLFDALLPATRVILVGDKNQLPPVENANVFADFIRLSGTTDLQVMQNESNIFNKIFPECSSNSISIDTFNHIVELKKSFRASQIINKSSRQILLGQYPQEIQEVKEFDYKIPGFEKGVYFVHAGSSYEKHLYSHLKSYMSNFLTDHYLNLLDEFTLNETSRPKIAKNILHHISQSRILGILNKGIGGQSSINQFCVRELKSHIRDRHTLVQGTPIINLVNNSHLNLNNGDIGVVLSIDKKEKSLYFMDTGGIQAITLNQMTSFEPAFAHTVHKSQGSEYNDILIVLPDRSDHALYSRELIYTAMTRAKNRVVVFGHKQIFKNMLEKRAERFSGPVAQIL